MKCTLCGFEFNENEAELVCRKCPLFKKCGLMKCPNCSFELVPEPKWVKKLKKKRKENV